MKSICFVSLFAYPLFNPKIIFPFGGMEIQMFRIGKYISRFPQIKVIFIVGDYGQMEREIYGKVEVFKAYPLDRKGWKRKILMLYYPFKMINILKMTDCEYYIQKAAGVETFLTSIYCKIFKKHFIYMTASDIDCNGYFIKSRPITGKLYLWGLIHADKIIVQSQTQANMLRQQHNLNSTVLKNSIRIPKRMYGKRKYITWVSRLDKMKNPELFMQLAKSIPDYSFLMIAPESTDHKYSQNIRIASNKIPNLKFIPGLNYKNTMAYIKDSLYIVNTSDYEGFPNTFIEAAIYGIPVISLNVNPDGFINQYTCGFWANGNTKAMISFINQTTRQQWKLLSNNIYRYAFLNHDLKTNSSNFLKLIFSS